MTNITPVPTADDIRATAEWITAGSRDPEGFKRYMQRAAKDPHRHLGAALVLLLGHHRDRTSESPEARLAAATETAIQALAVTAEDGE
jgi:hypothetical protein